MAHLYFHEFHMHKSCFTAENDKCLQTSFVSPELVRKKRKSGPLPDSLDKSASYSTFWKTCIIYIPGNKRPTLPTAR